MALGGNIGTNERAMSPTEKQMLFALFSQKVALPRSEFDEFSKHISVRDFASGQYFTRIGSRIA